MELPLSAPAPSPNLLTSAALLSPAEVPWSKVKAVARLHREHTRIVHVAAADRIIHTADVGGAIDTTAANSTCAPATGRCDGSCTKPRNVATTVACTVDATYIAATTTEGEYKPL